MEEEAVRGPPREAHVLVGGRRVLGDQVLHGRDHRCERQRGLEDEDRAPKACERPLEQGGHRDGAKGVPGRTSDDDRKADGEAWGEKMMAPKLDGGPTEDGEREATREFLKLGVPRQFRTKDEDYQEHGCTRAFWAARRGRSPRTCARLGWPR